MSELRLQSFDVVSKHWSHKGHVDHAAKRDVKAGLYLWQNLHAVDALNGIGLVQLSKLVLIEFEEGLILIVITDILRALRL